MAEDIQILTSSSFRRSIKKLDLNQINILDEAIKSIINNPKIGTQKKGPLKEIWVYKFKILNQEYLLAYKWDSATRTLMAFGVHENFYRDLEKKI